MSVSEHGNLLRFGGPAVPGADYEHLRVGALSEDYVLCYRHPTTNAYVNAFDVGSAGSGFGAATTTDGGTNGLEVVRSTSDGGPGDDASAAVAVWYQRI